MNTSKRTSKGNETNLLDTIMFGFFPYWPVLICFTIICLTAAFAYLYIARPTFEASATLLVKDEKKGYEDSQMMESLNIFGTKKIVENEIEVIHSRALMKDVVKSLGLYAPIYREGRLRSVSAYVSSPIKILIKDPEEIIEREKVYFTFDRINLLVKINGQSYPVDQWVKTELGDLKFVLNNKEKVAGPDPLYFSLIPEKKVVNNMLKNLNVTAANKLSSVVYLQFQDEVPERAEDILNELIHTYNRAGLNDKNALADNTLQFVDDRLKHVAQQLDTVEKKVQLYRSETGAINLSEQSALFLKNVGENDQRVALINMQLSVLDQVQNYVNSGKTKGTIVPSTLGVNDPVLSQLLQRLYEAELEYEKLKQTTAENNPLLISLYNEIKRIKPTIIESIKVQRINLNASRNQLNTTNKSYTEVLNSLPEKERKLLEISREKSIINNVYNYLLQKREETALSSASTLPDSRILDMAESSIKPVSPKKLVTLIGAIIASVIFTILFISLKDFVSSKIVFRSDIENTTEIPVLGELVDCKPNRHLVPDKSKSEYIRKQISQIIASLGLFNKDNQRKKILITSAISGEGKSFLSLNLALALASSGKKIILIDLNFKNSGLSNAYTATTSPGLMEYLNENNDSFEIIHSTEYSNLHVLKSGVYAPNINALLTTDRMENLFSFLQQSFDFIIIDSATVDPVFDSLIQTQYSDYIIHVLRHRFTPKKVLEFLDSKQNSKSLSTTGIVFNAVKSRGFIKGYTYGNSLDYFYIPDTSKKESSVNSKEMIKEI